MRSEAFEISTSGRLVTDITDRVEAFCKESRADGIVHVFLPHATAGLALMETGSGSEEDLEEVIARLLPRDDRYAHRHGSTGHGGDHLLPVFVSPSLTLPVERGGLALRPWPRGVVIDPNRENNRRPGPPRLRGGAGGPPAGAGHAPPGGDPREAGGARRGAGG